MSSKQFKIAPFLIIVVASAILGFGIGKFGKSLIDIQLPKGVVGPSLLLFIPSFLLVIAIHEAGHALMGVLLNFDFKLYVVGPFMWERDSAGWKFKWNTNVNTAGGLVVCFPKSDHNLRNRFALYAGAGPLASLLLTGIATAAYSIFSNAGYFIISSFFVTTAILSLMIFLVTIVPLHIGGFSSDGSRVMRLLQGGDVSRFELLVLKLIANSTNGVRPKDMNRDELEEALVLAKKLNAPFEVYVYAYLYENAFDAGDLHDAENYLQEYVAMADSIPDGVRNMVWLEAAFFNAYVKKDIETAKSFYDRFKPAMMISKAQIFATEAAILLLEGKNDEAQIKKEAAIADLPNMIDKGGAVALREKLGRLGLKR